MIKIINDDEKELANSLNRTRKQVDVWFKHRKANHVLLQTEAGQALVTRREDKKARHSSNQTTATIRSKRHTIVGELRARMTVRVQVWHISLTCRLIYTRKRQANTCTRRLHNTYNTATLSS